jgi:hypothetical protein
MSSRNNQVFTGFKCTADFRALVQQASAGDLSKFIRDALVEKLKRMHIPVDPALAAAPSRLGKGGPKKRAIVPFEQQPPALRAAETPESIPLPPSKPTNYRTKKKKGPKS